MIFRLLWSGTLQKWKRMSEGSIPWSIQYPICRSIECFELGVNTLKVHALQEMQGPQWQYDATTHAT